MFILDRKIHRACVLGMLLIVVGWIYLSTQPQIVITFDNTTSSSISNLQLTYTGLHEAIKLTSIASHASLKYDLVLEDSFQEGQVEIVYTDSHNKVNQYILIGYLEKGYNGTVHVMITEDGDDLSFEIEEDIQL